MTIYELKRLNQANGGHFFDKETMKYFGETLKSFYVRNFETYVELESKCTGLISRFRKSDGRFIQD